MEGAKGRRRRSAECVLAGALAISTACVNGQETRLAGPGTVAFAVLSADPQRVVPEFLSGPHCPAFPPFGARLALIVSAGRDVTIQAPRFEFVDRFGGIAVPTVFPVPTPPTGSSTVPTPSASPIPIPSPAPPGGLFVSAGTSRSAPFFLQFGCGVPAAGTLFVGIDAVDRRGRSYTARVSVRVGG